MLMRRKGVGVNSSKKEEKEKIDPQFLSLGIFPACPGAGCGPLLMAWGLVSMRQEFSSSVTLHPPMEEAENSLCACSYVPGWDWGLGQVPPKGNGAV